MREERKLRLFENMVLRRIFGPRRDEVTGEWRRLHNEELNDLYSSPNIVWVIKWRIRWAGHVAGMGEEREVYRFLVGKPDGKRPLGRPRRRWVDNIRMDLQEVICGYMDWIGLAQVRDRWRTLVSAVMNLRVIYTLPRHHLLTTNRPARAHHFLLARPLPRSRPNQIYIPRTILPLTYFIHLPMKMEPIVSSET